MKNSIYNFFEKPFIKNVVILASGTAMAQLLNMLFTPVITRVYGPAAYGLMGTFSAVIQMLAPLAAFSYPIAIVLPKNNEDAIPIVKLSLITTFLNTVLISSLIIIYYDAIINLFNLQSISGYVYLIPISILFAGVMQTIEQWLIRNNLYISTAKANLYETIIINSGKLLVGLLYPLGVVLVLLTAMRQGIKAFLLYKFSNIKLGNKTIFINISDKKNMIKQAKRYKDFPIYRTPEITLSSISANIPVLLLTVFFGPTSAGFYSVAKTVLGVPSSLIAKSVGDVFYPKASETAQNSKSISKIVIRATLYLVLIGIIPYGLIFIFGPRLFSLVFGEEWHIAGEYARWISVWSFFNFINKPSIQTLPVIDGQKFQLIFTIVKLAVTSLSLVFGFNYFNNDLIAIALFGISGGLSYILLILLTIHKSKLFDKKIKSKSNS